MSSIQIICNLENFTADITEDSILHNHAHLFVGVDQHKNLQSFRLGYKVTDSSSNIIKQEDYPYKNSVLITTDQEYIIQDKLVLRPNTTYTLYFYYILDGNKTDINYEFNTPYPIKPFNSWTWNGFTWISPVEPPDDYGDKDRDYNWNETEQKWELANNE